jgi:hypothetical protein
MPGMEMDQIKEKRMSVSKKLINDVSNDDLDLSIEDFD